jgi:hypothetical protein
MRWIFGWMMMLAAYLQAASFTFSYPSTVPSVQIQQDIVAAGQNVAQFLLLTHDINVAVSFDILPGSILAESAPAAYCAHWNATYAPYMLVPAALYVQGTGAANCPSASGVIHINMMLNTVYLSQYNYCPECRPDSGLYDFITVVMHELVHGLGMTTSIDALGVNANAPFCSVFDCFIFRNSDFGWPGSFDSPIPSTILLPSVLTSAALYFNGTADDSYFALYAPSVFVAGESIAHTAFLNLMYFQLSRGITWHILNDNIVGMLSTFGYATTNCNAPDTHCGNCLLHYPCFVASTSSAEKLSAFLSFLF